MICISEQGWDADGFLINVLQRPRTLHCATVSYFGSNTRSRMTHLVQRFQSVCICEAFRVQGKVSVPGCGAGFELRNSVLSIIYHLLFPRSRMNFKTGQYIWWNLAKSSRTSWPWVDIVLTLSSQLLFPRSGHEHIMFFSIKETIRKQLA